MKTDDELIRVILNRESTNICQVEEGKLIPCEALFKSCEVDYIDSTHKGLLYQVSSPFEDAFKEKQRIQIYLVLTYEDKRYVLNYCPFCGINLKLAREPKYIM